jgi:cell division protein FtsL
MPKKTQFQIIFCLIVMAVISIMYYYNHQKTLALEEELIRLDKKLYLIEVTFERRQKEYKEQSKLRHAKIERIIKELKSEK